VADQGPVAGDVALRRHTLFAFSLPAIMLGFTHGPEPQLQGIYAKHAAIPLATLATAVLLTRLFDAFTYPLIGAWSDHTFRTTGTRKAWIVAGTVVTVTGLWFLYRPPPGAGVTWFGGWFALTYLGWKMSEIPYTAWSIGLTREYAQRARVQLWRGVATLCGGIVFFSMPLVSKALGLTDTSELNFQTLGLTAVVIAVCVPLLNLYALAVVPDGEAAPPQAATSRVPLRAMLGALARNPALLKLMGALVPFTVLVSMSGSVSYLYVDVYLGIADKLTVVLLAAAPCTLLSLPFWGLLCLKYERHRVWAVSMVLIAIAYAGMGFATPGPSAFYWLVVCYPLGMFCIGASVVAVPAMLGDIVDYDRLQTGRDHAGIYAAMLAFTNKSLAGVSAALGLATLAWFGFDAAAKEQTPLAIFGARLVSVWSMSLGLALIAPLIWSFPITRARQKEILEALRRNEAAAQSGDLTDSVVAGFPK
jgi:Na+/melibiose symporter-like transporter